MTQRATLVLSLFALTGLFGCSDDDGVDCFADPDNEVCVMSCMTDPTQDFCSSPDGGPEDGGPGDFGPRDMPGSDGGPCGVCEGTTPVCDADNAVCVACLTGDDCGGETPECLVDAEDSTNNRCVGCRDAGDCGGDTPLCHSTDFECVACESDGDCTDPEAAQCDTATNTCVPCDDSAQCTEGDLGTCDTTQSPATCVECTVATEATDCGANSCDPATNECTDTMRGSLDPCDACVADSECEADHYCVPMNYMGTARGGYCLKDTTGGCDQPYSIALTGRTTLSGRSGASYCGIFETLATCEAVLALVDNQTCPGGMDSECPESGLCRTVGVLSNRCTYRCADASVCKEPPLAGNTCGDGGDAGSDDFCGG